MKGAELEMGDGSLLFQEKYAMAQSQKNLWTKMVNSWKCVMVSLSSSCIQVRLHGILGLLVIPFGADINHTVPMGSVISLEKKRKIMGYDEISMVFRLPSGGERELLLYLKRGEEFLNLVTSIRGC